MYMPCNRAVRIESRTYCKIAVCATPVDEDSEPQHITQDEVRMVRLGVKPWERDTTFIIDGTTNAKKLTVGEAYVTPGNWAGFPPHKHDIADMPNESVLEEVYYFLFDPPRDLRCSVFIPKTARSMWLTELRIMSWWSSPGVSYYCLCAGIQQLLLVADGRPAPGLFRSNDPDHQWVSAVENMIKKY